MRGNKSKYETWKKVRTSLLEELERAGNASDYNAHCEICGACFGIAFAHRMKRRKMPSIVKDYDAHVKELGMAAYLCVRCHTKLEHGPAEVMYDKITEIVTRRRGQYSS